MATLKEYVQIRLELLRGYAVKKRDKKLEKSIEEFIKDVGEFDESSKARKSRRN